MSRKKSGNSKRSRPRSSRKRQNPAATEDENTAGSTDLPGISQVELLTSIPLPMLIYDRNLKVIHANRFAIESLAFDPSGMSKEEINKQLSPHNGSGSNGLTDRLITGHVLEGKMVRNVYCRFRNSAGEVRINLGSTTPLRSGGRITGAVTAWHDITERVQREQIAVYSHQEEEGRHGSKKRIARLREDLDQTRRLSSIGTLAATVAHELRNPLGVIRTAAYNLQRKNSDASLKKHIDNIHKKINESVLIINNLLNYSSIQSPSMQRVSLAGIIADSIKSAEKLFPEKAVKVHRELRRMRGRSLKADPEQLREVFTNIIKNAFQAVEEAGEVKIEADIIGRRVRVEVSDNGSGVSEENMEKVFEPFFTSRAKGTGLGLSICRELIELHGGDISIHSEEKNGTTVTVVLPLERETG